MENKIGILAMVHILKSLELFYAYIILCICRVLQVSTRI